MVRGGIAKSPLLESLSLAIPGIRDNRSEQQIRIRLYSSKCLHLWSLCATNQMRGYLWLNFAAISRRYRTQSISVCMSLS